MNQEFKNAYDLSKGINREVHFWNWLDAPRYAESEYGFLSGYNKLRKLGKVIDDALSSSPGDDQIQQKWVEQITDLYLHNLVLDSKTPKAQLVENTRKTDLELAFYVLSFFHDSLVNLVVIQKRGCTAFL